MKNNFFFLLIFSVATFTSYAQVGKQFPDMQTESLTNKSLDIPKDLSKYTLIGLAYSKKSEQDLKTWFDPIYNQFIHKDESPSIFSFSFDVHCYFIPMFTGAKRVAYKKVMNKMKKTIDKRIQPNVMFYKGDLKKYKEALNFKGKDVPYFYVLDPKGKIVYATSGKYSDSKMQQIVDAVRDVME